MSKYKMKKYKGNENLGFCDTTKILLFIVCVSKIGARRILVCLSLRQKS
jgi:hypothetical protein